jgi:hypothetical protein
MTMLKRNQTSNEDVIYNSKIMEKFNDMLRAGKLPYDVHKLSYSAKLVAAILTDHKIPYTSSGNCGYGRVRLDARISDTSPPLCILARPFAADGGFCETWSNPDDKGHIQHQTVVCNTPFELHKLIQSLIEENT